MIMADSNPAHENQTRPVGGTASRARSASGGIAGWVLSALLVVVAFPTFVVLAVGLAPSLVTFFVERGANRSAARSMAMMNMAGVAPVVAMLWSRGHTTDVALALLADPYNWLLMYGAAAIGLGLLWLMQWTTVVMHQSARGQRLRWLTSRQQKLIEEWGKEVAGGPGGTG